MGYQMNVEDGVLTFTIDRPEIRNAVNYDVIEGFEQLAVRVAGDESIKLVILTGAGDQAFCSGGDLTEFHSLRTEDEAYSMLKRMGDALYGVRTLPVPTVALVNGSAVGGGCEIATACDYRLVREHAKCGFIQGRLAMTSGWGGGTYLLDTLRHDRAMKMLTEARTYTAEQLGQAGWATLVAEDDEAVEAFLAPLKKTRPEVHRAYKRMMIQKWEAAGLKDRVDAEVRTCAVLWAEDAHHEAVEQFLAKSKK